MDKFLDLLAQSVIVQGLVTLTLVCVTCYLAVAGQEIPQLVADATLLALGYYFGSKSQMYVNSVQRRK